MKIAVIGATGLVGREMLKVLAERSLSITKIIPAASARSVGKEVEFSGKLYKIVSIEDAINEKPHIALFSAGSETSLKYAKAFTEVGTVVIDNSSAWRMCDDVKLIVPEVNGHTIESNDKLIANPNCSTIQLVTAINPLHQVYKLKRLIISTYQSVTGSGLKGITQLNNERSGIEGEKCYPHQIFMNLIPHGGNFLNNGYTAEEMKLVHETHKILGDNSIGITATVVRVPVTGGHSESVNAEFHHSFKLEDIRKILSNAPEVIVQDHPLNNLYPMPLHIEGKDEVFVGRIRIDESTANALNLWVVADNLRKGAATNAIQIAQYIIAKGLIA